MSNDKLMTTAEVGALFRVNPKTVSRWAATGRIEAVRTPGGRFRIPRSAVRQLLAQPGDPQPQLADKGPTPCHRRNPHTNHGACPGIAPEFTHEDVEQVADRPEGGAR